MGTPIQTLEVIGLADGQHNNLRNLPMANNINRQTLKKPEQEQRIYENQGS